uniref:NADH-ubiquinone oxidoreductase chain 6 n=1 Tax=Gastrolina thoracica TaxID=2041218 RepID=A0A343KIF1_9CUCU|nr:NADH dehydrogenase subunit 6 [Gastrolina thoracica]ATG33629.1 NADH dehydrogenase subunit 6 [Gastrolina thoracica]
MLMYLPLMMMCSMLFMFMSHPLTCGMMLLMQTILICLMTGFMSLNFWFSYILFLIMIGGMLILFMYMTSIASNEKFKFNLIMLITLMMLLMIMLIFMLLDNNLINMKTQIIDLKLNMNLNNNMSMIKYFNFPNSMILFLMIIYLLFTLIAIVKITKISNGPLRQKF